MLKNSSVKDMFPIWKSKQADHKCEQEQFRGKTRHSTPLTEYVSQIMKSKNVQNIAFYMKLVHEFYLQSKHIF